MLCCRECPPDAPKYVSVDELEIHITSDHLAFFPYECERCRFAKFPTLYALTMHCREDHKLLEFYVRYKYSEENERKMQEAKLRLYQCIQEGAGRARSEEERAAMLPPIDGSATVREFCTDRMAAIKNEHNLCDVKPVQCDEEYAASSSSSSTAEGRQNSATSNFDISAALQDTSAAVHVEGQQALIDFNSDNFTTTDYQQLVGEAEQLMKKPKAVVTCQLCGLNVSNQRSSLVYHANTKHIKLNLYQCTVCSKNWQTIAKSDVLKHVRAVHNGNESMIIDNRKRLCHTLRLFTQKCFPPPSTKPRGRPPLGSEPGKGSDGGSNRQTPEEECMEDMEDTNNDYDVSNMYGALEAFVKDPIAAMVEATEAKS